MTSEATPSTARESTTRPRGRGRGHANRQKHNNPDFVVADGAGPSTNNDTGSGSKRGHGRGGGRGGGGGRGPRKFDSSLTPSTSADTRPPREHPQDRRERPNRPHNHRPDHQQQHARGGGGDHDKAKRRPAPELSPDADLTTTLIHTLSNPPYADCPICFNAIHPAQPTWSCSPSPSLPNSDSLSSLSESPQQKIQYCWTPFHMKCIKSWASKSVKDLEDAYRARGEPNRKGSWRCPGCQAIRDDVPNGYRCFCGSTPHPTLSHLATPHSCGAPCSRKNRPKGCTHPCPLLCHPGPCPPCKITLTQNCLCGKKQILVKCGTTSSSSVGQERLRCDQPCNLTRLGCTHTCKEKCHAAPCPPCPEIVKLKCACGKEEREFVCGERPDEDWNCENICDRPFPCQHHHCPSPCHKHTQPTCPYDPITNTTCPCGAHPLIPSSLPFLLSPTQDALILPRTKCTDPLPTCTSPCSKPLPPSLCANSPPHTCAIPCHIGPCDVPCQEKLSVPCRCGSTIREIRCSDLIVSDGIGGKLREEVILCDKPCPAFRRCGHHRCNRICCPLASFARTGVSGGGKKGKGRRVNIRQGGVGLGDDDWDEASMDPEGLHICDLPCGKLLGCGLHKCEERDHKGACGRCLRSNFEEVTCHCGRTTLEPPIPCGTVLRCPFPCARLPPPCGHPRDGHACHGEARRPQFGVSNEENEAEQGERSGCPPCVHLTTKLCACGKKEVPNVRCALPREKVSCGVVCGRTLECGFHKCPRPCHPPSSCGPCVAQCGKPRRHCLPLNHPCTLPCHAPSACPEDKEHPCQALITLTCACGIDGVKRDVKCGNTADNAGEAPQGKRHTQVLKCTDECAIKKRNRRLAEALQIDSAFSGSGSGGAMSAGGDAVPGTGGARSVGTVVWKDEVVSYARLDMKFLALLEKTLRDFVLSEKKKQVLPHMPIERRKFVISVAAVYRLDTEMVDQEPHRSVQLVRRIDTRIPNPLLSTFIHSSSASSSTTTSTTTTGISTPSPLLHTSLRTSTPSPGPTGAPIRNSAALAAAAASTHSWRPSPVPSPKPAVAASGSTASGGGSGAWTSKRVAAVRANEGEVVTPAVEEPAVENWENDDEI